MDGAPDPNRCPRCGGPNACALAAGCSTSCWCTTVAIAPAALARLPEAARGRACVCRACATDGVSAAESNRLPRSNPGHD